MGWGGTTTLPTTAVQQISMYHVMTFHLRSIINTYSLSNTYLSYTIPHTQHLAPPYPYGFVPLLLQQFPNSTPSIAPSGFTHFRQPHQPLPSTLKQTKNKYTYRIRRHISHVDCAFAPHLIDATAVECDAWISAPCILADAVKVGGGSGGWLVVYGR